MSQPIVSTGATYFFRISFIALYCSSQSGGVGWGTSSDICMSFFFLGEGDSNFMDLAFRDSDFRARVGFGVVGVTDSSAEGCIMQIFRFDLHRPGVLCTLRPSWTLGVVCFSES